jgi:hypothetical protein
MCVCREEIGRGLSCALLLADKEPFAAVEHGAAEGWKTRMVDKIQSTFFFIVVGITTVYELEKAMDA